MSAHDFDVLRRAYRVLKADYEHRDAALATDLWGFHIAHGSQNIASETMYPHNWNLAFRSDAMVVGLMREWFSLQVQQGVQGEWDSSRWSLSLGSARAM